MVHMETSTEASQKIESRIALQFGSTTPGNMSKELLVLPQRNLRIVVIATELITATKWDHSRHLER